MIKASLPAAESDAANIHFLDYWRVITSRKEIVLTVALLVFVTAVFTTRYLMPKKYEAESLIRVQQDALNMEPYDVEATRYYNPHFLLTEFEIIQSRQVLDEVMDLPNLRLQERWGQRYGEEGITLGKMETHLLLKKNMNVQQYRNTSLISIRVRSVDPQETADIANGIATVYLQQRVAGKKREVMAGLDALESRLARQQEKMDAAENRVEQLRKELGVTYVGRGIRPDSLKIQQLEADLINYRVDMLARKVRLEQLEKLEGDELITASSFVVFDRTLESIRSQLMDSEVKLRILLENLGDNHPEVRQVRSGVDELRKKLRGALEGLKNGLRVDYEVARVKVEQLEAELNRVQQSDIRDSSEKYLPFEKAQRDLVTKRQLLEALQARIIQHGIEMEIPRTPVEIVEFAEAPPAERYVSPNWLLNLLLSLVTGLGLGVGLAFFIEYLDTSVKTVDEIERFLGLPVVGVIPQKVRPLNQENPDPAHAEAYRVLRTNIEFADDGNPGGAYALISGSVGEGKSTTLLNLAVVCAGLGHKVLIVDSDLRRPVQHRFFNLPNDKGLCNVLHHDVAVEEVIKSTTTPNLDLLPSGKLAPGTVGLLDARRLRDLIVALKKQYTYVLFDSPPVMGVSDTSIIASVVDGVLLVVQHRKYPRAMTVRAKRLLENVGANILGTVLNNINILKDEYFYYHTYYQDVPHEEPAAPGKSKGKAGF